MSSWHFGSTEQAYDACQSNERIATGDTLVVETEEVVGLAWTWPVAVTAASGALHGTTVPPALGLSQGVLP